MALAGANELEVGDYTMVVSHLMQAKAWVPAIEVMDAGKKKFPDNPKMDLLVEKVVAESKAAGDDAATAALQGLGYM